jgi:formylglycine-generating enzyme
MRWPIGVGGLAALLVACGGRKATEAAAAGIAQPPTATQPGEPRPGMVWIPAGVMRAGSPVDDVPRVADAEPVDAEVSMTGFYVDLLPWPNEPGAIPTTNVTREEARLLCEGRGKRLCSELEWERACKGPDNNKYEYGASYDAHVCGAGMPAETSSRRPSGQRRACRSGFGTEDMHGGAFEWTDSTWGRGAHTDLGVLRGGNDLAGELVTRCAYARPLAAGERSALTGFRCCAGAHNDAAVELQVKSGSPFERAEKSSVRSPPLDALDGASCGSPAAPAPCSSARAWTWRPSPNVELSVSGGCLRRGSEARCAVGASRRIGDRVETLVQVDTGSAIPEVVLVEGADHRLRVRGGDGRRFFFRELTFSYGRVDVRPVR